MRDAHADSSDGHLDLPEIMAVFEDAAQSAKALAAQHAIPMPQSMLPEWSADAALALKRMADAFELIAQHVGVHDDVARGAVSRPSGGGG